MDIFAFIIINPILDIFSSFSTVLNSQKQQLSYTVLSSTPINSHITYIKTESTSRDSDISPYDPRQFDCKRQPILRKQQA